VTRTRLVSLLVALCTLTAAVTLTACGGDDDDDGNGDGGAGATQLNLTIGNLVPLTGDLSDFGPPGRKAADLAVEQINTAIREVGADHQVAVRHADSQTDPQAGVSAARRLVSSDNASCIAGSWASSVSIPVARTVAVRERVLQISPASTSDEITGLDDNGLMNRTVPPDSFQGPALADAIDQAVEGADGKTVNIGARNDAYGTGLADTFEEAWTEKGGQIGEKVVYDPDQPSYDSEARQITSGDPDAFVIIDFPETYQKVGPALVRTGDFDPSKAWATDGLASGSLPKDAGEEATEGMRGTAPGSPDEGAAADAFDRLYEEAGGPDRQTFDAQNFDAVMLCYLAAVAAGSTEGPEMAEQVRNISNEPGEKYTFEQLPDAIRALQDGQEIDFDGASGPIDMNDQGDATAGVYDIYQYEDGELDTVDEVPLPEE
jgi:ABC-type branched-subunit amino acid transport system substrate-binding protein